VSEFIECKTMSLVGRQEALPRATDSGGKTKKTIAPPTECAHALTPGFGENNETKFFFTRLLLAVGQVQ